MKAKIYIVHISALEHIRLKLVAMFVFEVVKWFMSRQDVPSTDELLFSFTQEEGDAYRVQVAAVDSKSGAAMHLDLPSSLRYGDDWRDAKGALVLPEGEVHGDCIDLILTEVLFAVSIAGLRVAVRSSEGFSSEELVNDHRRGKKTYSVRFHRTPESA